MGGIPVQAGIPMQGMLGMVQNINTLPQGYTAFPPDVIPLSTNVGSGPIYAPGNSPGGSPQRYLPGGGGLGVGGSAVGMPGGIGAIGLPVGYGRGGIGMQQVC